MATVTVAATVLALAGGTPAGAASTKPSVTDFSQCANDPAPSTSTACPGGWINGILQQTNSHYRENESVPQRLFLDFPAGSQVNGETVTIQYQTLKGGIHAYDSLATYDTTQTGITPAVLCSGAIAAACGAVVAAGPLSTYPIPLDPTSVAPTGAGISAVTSAHQLAGQVMTLYGGTITAIGDPVHTASGANDENATQTVTFDLPGGGTVTTVDTHVLLAFGGHLAASGGPTGWGAGLGAGSVSGGPYHISLVSAGPIGNPTTFGGRDNQIMAGALIAPASPTITTVAAPTAGTAGTALANVGDTATFHGTAPATPPTGSVTFTLYSDAACTVPVPAMSGTGPITTAGATSTATWSAATWTPPTAGTYQWIASYPGDANNAAFTTACGDANERIAISSGAPIPVPTPATPTVSTQQSASSTGPGTMPLGASVTDTASVVGDAAHGVPTGQVAFFVCGPLGGPAACPPASGTALGTVATATASPTSSGATSVSFTPTAVGTYCFSAQYSPATASYTAASENGSGVGVVAECVTVAATAPSGSGAPSLSVMKSSVPSSGSTVVPATVVTYTLTLSNVGDAPATGVVLSDTVPAGSTYVPGSATCGALTACAVSESGGTVTWTGVGLPAAAGGVPATASVTFQVQVNGTTAGGTVIANTASFTNEGTPQCTTATCPTNTVELTVVTPAVAASSGTVPVIKAASGSTGPIAGATTVHTGEPWAVARPLLAAVAATGLLLVGIGERRRWRSRRSAGPGGDA